MENVLQGLCSYFQLNDSLAEFTETGASPVRSMVFNVHIGNQRQYFSTNIMTGFITKSFTGKHLDVTQQKRDSRVSLYRFAMLQLCRWSKASVLLLVQCGMPDR